MSEWEAKTLEDAMEEEFDKQCKAYMEENNKAVLSYQELGEIWERVTALFHNERPVNEA